MRDTPLTCVLCQDQAVPLARARAVREDISGASPPAGQRAYNRRANPPQFENLISNTIEETKDIPEIISETGKIDMNHKEIMRKIGELFLLRTNINSVGSVLDSPVRVVPRPRPRARRPR